MTRNDLAESSRIASDDDPMLEIEGLRIETVDPVRTIVATVDLRVRAGETVGVVGESGSGKSMMAKSVIGLLPPTVRALGEIRYGGLNLLEMPDRERARFRGRDIGMIFQDPFTMLNPLLRVGEQMVESATGQGGGRPRGREARAEAERRLSEVGIHDPSVVARYPFQLSGGMLQRVGIAAALAADPRLLIADEPSTALDVTTQKEVLDLLVSLQRNRGMALVLITHDLRVAFSVCHRVAVMYAGRLLEVGTARQLHDGPAHPYTLGLLNSEPDIDRRSTKLYTISGSVPRPDDVTTACAFASRCAWSDDRCGQEFPELRDIGEGRLTACLRSGEISTELARTREVHESSASPNVADLGGDPLLVIEELGKEFPGSRRRKGVRAIESVSLTVRPGESVGIVGESGSGKTTLARCVVALECPQEGRIVLDGLPMWENEKLSRTVRSQIRSRVQMVFQDPYSSLNPRRSIGSTLAEALRFADAPPDDVKFAVAELLDRVGLPASYARRRPVRLSGGERQRVAVARALAVSPKLIVCDEPVSALDVSVQAQILNLLNELRSELGLSYLFITHDLAVVRQVVDRVYVMRSGHVVEDGPVDEVLDHSRHEYTQRLVASIPRTRPAVDTTSGLTSEVIR